MSYKDLKIEDFRIYDNLQIKMLKETINKAQNNKRILNFFISTFFNSFNILAVFNLMHLIIYTSPLLSIRQLIFMCFVIFLRIFKKRIFELIINNISYHKDIMKKIQVSFHEAFNSKDEQLKILFAKFIDKHGHQISFSKSDLYDLFQRIDNLSITKDDIDSFIRIDQHIDKIFSYKKDELSEQEKNQIIINMTHKELNSTNNISSKEFEKEFNFTKS